MSRVIIYTDGACSGNPGPGGWGAVLMYGAHKLEISGSAADTTNNRMELTAVIEALKKLNKECNVIIHTDSKYVLDGATKWMANWKKNGWRNASKKPVENSDLWLELDKQLNLHCVDWKWVKGHNGDEYNELADKLATSAIQK